MESNYSVETINYKNYRPSYGKELYSFISKIVSQKKLAWDVACGSGQATVDLADIFERVIATDSDEHQIRQAKNQENVHYFLANEYNNRLKDESVDFISVATGIHWLDTKKFYEECNRVLKTGGIVGVWGYTGININTQLDTVLKEIVDEFLMPFYPESIKIAFGRYEAIELPFQPVESPNFFVKKMWNFYDLKNYISSFSAMQRYKFLTGESGFYRFEKKLLDAWNEDPLKKKNFEWEIITKFSKKI